jgi:hypothetical protein
MVKNDIFIGLSTDLHFKMMTPSLSVKNAALSPSWKYVWQCVSNTFSIMSMIQDEKGEERKIRESRGNLSGA